MVKGHFEVEQPKLDPPKMAGAPRLWVGFGPRGLGAVGAKERIVFFSSSFLNDTATWPRYFAFEV